MGISLSLFLFPFLSLALCLSPLLPFPLKQMRPLINGLMVVKKSKMSASIFSSSVTLLCNRTLLLTEEWGHVPSIPHNGRSCARSPTASRQICIHLHKDKLGGWGVVDGRVRWLRGWECAVARYRLIIGHHMGTSSQFGQVLAGRG